MVVGDFRRAGVFALLGRWGTADKEICELSGVLEAATRGSANHQDGSELPREGRRSRQDGSKLPWEGRPAV